MMENRIRANLLSFISIPTDVKQSEVYNMRYKNLKPRVSQINKDILASGLKSWQTKFRSAQPSKEKKPRSSISLALINGI